MQIIKNQKVDFLLFFLVGKPGNLEITVKNFILFCFDTDPYRLIVTFY
jgi:hypothetical protein